MTILLAANSTNDYGVSGYQYATSSGLTAYQIFATTQVGTFDTVSTPYALACYNRVLHRINKELPSNPSTLWIHCMHYTSDSTSSTVLPDLIGFGIASGNEGPIFTIRKDDTITTTTVYRVMIFQGGNRVYLPGSFSIPINALREIDIKWFRDATVGQVEVYVNQTSVFSYTGNTQSDLIPSVLILGGSSASSATSGGAKFSEVIVADESTLRMRLRCLRVTSVASSTNWTTDIASLTALNGGTPTTHANPGAFSVTPGKIMYEFSDIPAADIAKKVRGVYVNQFMSRVGNSPIAGLRTVVDSGGTEYETANLDLFGNSETIQVPFVDNPVTGLSWTYSEVNSMKVGVKSV